MNSIRLLVLFIMIGCGVLVILTQAADEADAVNISVTLWNFTQFAGRTITISFSHSNVYEYDPEWGSGSFSYSYTFGSTSKTIELWCIMATAGEGTFSMWYQDRDVYGTYNVRFETSISEYSLDYEFQQNVTQRMDNIDENITSISENITSLNENVTLLNNMTKQLGDSILGIYNTTDLLFNITDYLFDNLTRFEEWRSTVQRDLVNMSDALQNLGFALDGIGHAQSYQAEALILLQSQFDTLNTTLTSLTAEVETLKAADLTWVEEDLTSLRAQIAAIEAVLEGLPLMEEDINAARTLVARALSDIGSLEGSMEALEDNAHAPYIYDDSELRDKVIHLEEENQLLQQRLTDLEDEQDEIKTATPSAAIGYIALVLALVGVLIGLAAFMMKRKGDAWVEG